MHELSRGYSGTGDITGRRWGGSLCRGFRGSISAYYAFELNTGENSTAADVALPCGGILPPPWGTIRHGLVRTDAQGWLDFAAWLINPGSGGESGWVMDQ